MPNKKYVVTYKTGQKETVAGRIVFFSNINTDCVSMNPKISPVVYLNADDVRSVVEIDTEGVVENGSNE